MFDDVLVLMKFYTFCRPQSWGKSAEFLLKAEENALNLVILGAEGLADKLQQEIQVDILRDYVLGSERHWFFKTVKKIPIMLKPLF